MNKPFHFNDNPMPKKTYKTKLSMKKIRLSHILQPNEKIYINTHNPPNKEGRTSIRAHSLAVVHEPQLNTNLFQRSNCPSSLACHTVYYIFTNRWGGENIKIISNVLQNRKANRIIYSKLIYMRDRQFLSYKMLCYVKPKGLGLITDMSVIYILAWIWSTNNQHLDRFSYLSSFDCYFPAHTHARTRTHTHTHTRARTSTHARTHAHTRTHARTHTRTRTHTHTHTHTRTHTPSLPSRGAHSHISSGSSWGLRIPGTDIWSLCFSSWAWRRDASLSSRNRSVESSPANSCKTHDVSDYEQLQRCGVKSRLFVRCVSNDTLS